MKPEPKPTKIVCSVCGLDWGKHTEKLKKPSARAEPRPTLETCVDLLKAELASRPKLPSFFASTSGAYTLTN